MDRLSALFEFLYSSIVVEIYALPFLLGLVLFVVGLLILGLFVLSRTLGYQTTGKVLGAIERTRIKKKERDGETIEKVKKSLIPVFEYTASDGKVRQMLSSEGGTSTLSYSTGQSVSLRVREDVGYDDVYDADSRGALYFGLIIGGIGLGLMGFIGSAVAALGVSVTLLALVAIALVVRALVDKFSGSTADSKPASSEQAAGAHKSYAPEDVKPIEYFKERENSGESAPS